jgi:pyruvate dehydrogenase E2 component (dihydrolipoamide acetyltransferase)
MPLEFKLPDIGEGTVEGEIVRWIVKPGDRVKADEPVLEVMTDKATVVLTAPKAGVIREIKAEAGKLAKVGSVLYVMDVDGEEVAAAPAKEAPIEKRAFSSESSARAGTIEKAAGAAGDGGERRAEAAGTATIPDRKPLATPATRKLARELDVDLSQIEGTGPGGRITDDDVRRAAGAGRARARVEIALDVGAGAQAQPSAERAEGAAPSLRPHAGAEAAERVPFRGLRRAIAQQMTRSKFTAPHFTYVEECDMSAIVALREREKARAEKEGAKLTYLPFIMKAAVLALKKHPYLNAELDEKAGEIILKKHYHFGVSVQTDAGLMVVVIRDVDKKSMLELARELERLIAAARAGKAEPRDLKGSTFTITSAGNIGGVLATPIINYPEVAILGVNQIKKRPVVRTNAKGEDEIAIRHMMYLSISLDHRVVDGAVAAHFMNDLVSYLEEPGRLAIDG